MIRSLCVVALASACSSSKPPPPAPVPCIAHFAGDVADTITATKCGAAADDAGASVFTAHGTGATITSFDVSITLASGAGTFSSETQANDWSASAASGDAGCLFVGGASSVPSGSYTLVLDDDGHGTLTMSLDVQSPAATDCGPHDVENVELTF